MPKAIYRYVKHSDQAFEDVVVSRLNLGSRSRDHEWGNFKRDCGLGLWPFLLHSCAKPFSEAG